MKVCPEVFVTFCQGSPKVRMSLLRYYPKATVNKMYMDLRARLSMRRSWAERKTIQRTC